MNEIDLKSVVKTFDQRMKFYRMVALSQTEYTNVTGKIIRSPRCTPDFNIWCENTYGLRITGAAMYTEYNVIDPKKYSIFLLKFSNAPVDS